MLLYPTSRNLPYRRTRLAAVRPWGLGDALMCTPGLRELKRINPECHLTFFTPYKEVFEGLPYLDEVHHLDEARQVPDTIWFIVEESLPPWRHIARIMADHLGLPIRDVRPDCVVNERMVRDYAQAWSKLPRPWIVVNRHTSTHTPNKDWFEESWVELIDRLLARCTVIEIGSTPVLPIDPARTNYVNLIGRTSLEQLVAVIAAGDLHIGPVSGPVHVAAAVGTPSVVIYGGYEKPVCSEYEGNINLSTDIHCSPCFLTTSCPYGKECLKRITPRMVEEAVDRLWSLRRKEERRPVTSSRRRSDRIEKGGRRE